MNRRGLSIDNINKKYRGGSFLGAAPASPNYFTTVASPVSMVSSPIVRRSVIRTPSPVISAVSPVSIARPVANTVVAVPPVRGSVFRAASPVLRAPSPVVIRKSVVRAATPVSTVVQPMTTTVVQQQPVFHQEPVVQETVVEKGGLIPVSKKVSTVRETTIPVYEIQEDLSGQRIGVSSYGGYQPAAIPQKSRCTCPWWLWLLLLLPLLGLLLLGLSKLFAGGAAGAKQESSSTTTQLNNTIVIDSGRCSPGFFFYNGNCMKCPAGSGWNTTHCVVKKVQTTTISKTMEVDPVPANTYGSSLKSSSLSSSSSFFEGYSGSQSSSGGSASGSASGSLTGSKTIGEEMKKLGLDYEGFRRKVDSEGGAGGSWTSWSGAKRCDHKVGDVVQPILENKHLMRLTTH